MDVRPSLTVWTALLGLALVHCATPPVPPPETSCEPVPLRRPLGGSNPDGLGFGDFHAHMLSEYAFGQYVFEGSAYTHADVPPDEQLARAIPECRHHSLQHFTTGLAVQVLEHPHGTRGHPTYASWPNHRTLLHQQMYVDWVYRAYRHGLRLMVLVITHSETLCESSHREEGAPCRDDDVALLQIDQVRRMLDAIARREGSWMQLAHTADEAAAIIQDNRLAVTLGIEVDTPFGCGAPGDSECRPESYGPGLDRLYDAGVRLINPIHLVDNGFGGAALYDEYLNINQVFLRGAVFDPDPERCLDDAVDFEFRGGLGYRFLAWLTTGVSYAPRYERLGGHCNVRGLSPAGEDFVRDLMARGMLVDLEHMSEKSVWHTLELAKATCADLPNGPTCYPLIASHSWFRDLKLPIGEGDVRDLSREDAAQIRAEMHKSSSMLKEISALGGVVGVLTNHGVVKPPHEQSPTCPTSSTSVAAALSYAVEQMGAGGVGFGTDFNGLAGQPSPRFGDDACGGRGESEHDPLLYPFDDYQGDRTRCTQAGERGFDFNHDGLAHYGLLPDLIADLEIVGASRSDVDRLFRSAQAYVDMWRRAEQISEALRRPDPGP